MLKEVQQYIADGVDVNYQNEDGDTALINASQYGHFKIVKFLVEQGANINIKNINDNTALDVAKENEHMKILEYLQNADTQ